MTLHELRIAVDGYEDYHPSFISDNEVEVWIRKKNGEIEVKQIDSVRLNGRGRFTITVSE